MSSSAHGGAGSGGDLGSAGSDAGRGLEAGLVGASVSSAYEQSVIGEGLPREESLVRAEAWMRRALAVETETPAGDIPVGAVVFGPDGSELGWGTNRREVDADPAGHAEVAAIRSATKNLGDAWRLEDCTLVVTLEPCAMCAGLALGARVGRIVFGASEPKTGACGSVWDLPREAPLHKAEVLGGVLADECEALLKNFFADLR